jgi:hypothetical protein
MHVAKELLETTMMGQYGGGEPFQGFPTQGPSTGLIVFYLLVMVLMIASYWKIFAKAGKPGWASIVPIYNAVVYLQMVNRPVWWIILFFIPIVNLVIALILIHDLSKSFGKGFGWTLGLLFLGIVFVPVLAFGGDQFVGREAA